MTPHEKLIKAVQLLRQDVYRKMQEMDQLRRSYEGPKIFDDREAAGMAAAYAGVVDMIDTLMRENNIGPLGNYSPKFYWS